MLLVVCATAPEAEAVLAPIRAPRERYAIGPYDAESAAAVATLVCGIGPAAAAAATGVALALGPYDAVLSAGVAGGFDLPVGSLAVADPIVPADVGVWGDGWQAFAAPVPTESAELADALGAARGPVLTVSTVTSTDSRALDLQARFPGALAEAMEGYGIACAAAVFDIPVYEIRAVSNAVGRYDRPTWDVPGALAALTAAMPTALEVLAP